MSTTIAISKKVMVSDSKEKLEQIMRNVQAYLCTVQACVEQFGEIRDEVDEKDWVAIMKKLENEVPRNIPKSVRLEVKKVISKIAIQKNPQKAWNILEEGYRSTQATINNIEALEDI